MSFYTVNVALPSTVKMTIRAANEDLAARVADEFVVTAFANALQFWADNEPICDDEDRLLGEVSIEMPAEGMIRAGCGRHRDHRARGIATMTPVKTSKRRGQKKAAG